MYKYELQKNNMEGIAFDEINNRYTIRISDTTKEVLIRDFCIDLCQKAKIRLPNEEYDFSEIELSFLIKVFRASGYELNRYQTELESSVKEVFSLLENNKEYTTLIESLSYNDQLQIANLLSRAL